MHDFIEISLGSMLSMGGNNSFSLNNDYSIIFDNSYSLEFAHSAWVGDYYNVSFLDGNLTIEDKCIYCNTGSPSYSVNVVNHLGGTTNYTEGQFGTPTTLNIGVGGDGIIEIYIIDYLNAYEINILNGMHFLVSHYRST